MKNPESRSQEPAPRTHWKSCPCPECESKRDEKRFRLFLAAAIIGAVLAFIALSGCAGTVTPAAVESHQASFDQGEQNSGVVALIPGGAIITPRAHERYNGLVAIYGREFLPTIAFDYGITPRADGNYEITAEALQKFILLNQWHRMGREPKN